MKSTSSNNVGLECHSAFVILATAVQRAASGNNDRLSTPWREMISLADAATSISGHRRTELAVSRSARQSAWREGSEYD
ncbi:hypothetical protein QA635_30305 [Bradyrhizobium brasilense]|uniref:hypothetical protein n=1 Tax=Bradyrhizobium brasilense TaxID=1419277 RepID=UPI0024B205DB|nr:hypothetical protein [Bradyrhizobium australafricanum]WFU30849.1 hypothetical protein QA635_30305 [Bradyrhizobium australafricanum]